MTKKTKRTVQIMETILPCNGCTACCETDIVFLHPECGDKAKNYATQMVGDRIALAHKRAGGCIYLEPDKGCKAWERRPAVCREMDCRRLLKMQGTTVEPYIGKHVMDAAYQLALRMAREKQD